MRLALAQIKPTAGDVAANIVAHVAWIEKAAAQQCDAVFFPELSLTGYEPELAAGLAMVVDDTRLDVFTKLSDTHGITIGVGAPTREEAGVCISMFVFQPGGRRTVYSKQILHDDEKPYFVCGHCEVLLDICRMKVAPAICYESLQPRHAEAAARAGAQLYMASVAKPHRSLDKAFLHYPAMAKEHGMAVAMVNAVGWCDNFQSAGQSAVWNGRGEEMGRLDGKSQGLLVSEA